MGLINAISSLNLDNNHISYVKKSKQINRPQITTNQEGIITNICLSGITNDKIYYTLDGTMPSTTSNSVNNGDTIALTNKCTVRAKYKDSSYESMQAGIENFIAYIDASCFDTVNKKIVPQTTLNVTWLPETYTSEHTYLDGNLMYIGDNACWAYGNFGIGTSDFSLIDVLHNTGSSGDTAIGWRQTFKSGKGLNRWALTIYNNQAAESKQVVTTPTIAFESYYNNGVSTQWNRFFPSNLTNVPSGDYIIALIRKDGECSIYCNKTKIHTFAYNRDMDVVASEGGIALNGIASSSYAQGVVDGGLYSSLLFKAALTEDTYFQFVDWAANKFNITFTNVS
jgi:hypothetical protein